MMNAKCEDRLLLGCWVLNLKVFSTVQTRSDFDCLYMIFDILRSRPYVYSVILQAYEPAFLTSSDQVKFLIGESIFDSDDDQGSQKKTFSGQSGDGLFLELFPSFQLDRSKIFIKKISDEKFPLDGQRFILGQVCEDLVKLKVCPDCIGLYCIVWNCFELQ